MEKDDTDHILTELHDGLAGGHFVREITAHEILREGYDWPTLFIDAHAHAQKCQIYQVNAGRERSPSFPLHPILVQNHCGQWGLEVVGEINPNSSKLHK